MPNSKLPILAMAIGIISLAVSGVALYSVSQCVPKSTVKSDGTIDLTIKKD